MVRFAGLFWIPDFAGMTVETGTHIRHAGESRHPGRFPKMQVLNPKKCRCRQAWTS
jgi:hypothetical protein